MRILGAILGFIFGLFRRSSQRRNRDRALDNIDVQNETSRNVIQYRACPIENFVPRETAENIVVSGANADLRNRINSSVAWNCHQTHRAAVILHCGNTALSELMRSNFSGETGFYAIDSTNPMYDPFVGLGRNEIAQLILNSSGTHYKIERMGNSYIYGLTDYLQLLGRPICTETYANCLRDRSYEQIMEQAESGAISDFIARRINSELSQGQLELGNIEQYFSVLRGQGNHVLADETLVGNATSIKKALRQNEVIMLDLQDSTNDLLISVVVQEIRDAISAGSRFTLIVDSLPLDTTESLGQLLRNFSGQCKYVYSSQDVYTDMQSTSNIFNTLLGRAHSVFVLQHYSSDTSSEFSKFLGEYQKVEVNHTFTQGDSYMTFGQVLPGSNSADVYGTQLVNKPRVEAYEISSQSSNHVYIKQNGNNEIVSVECTRGSARSEQTIPVRLDNQHSRRRTHQINWGIFVVLLIFCYPAAFIYSFIKSRTVGKIISAIFLLFFIFYIIAAIASIYA